MRSKLLFPCAFLVAIATGCFHQEVATDSLAGARGQLLFGKDGQGTLDYYGVVGVPWRVNIARYEPQDVPCAPKQACLPSNYTPTELVEARCLGGACTVDHTPGKDGRSLDLAVMGLREGDDTLIVKVRRTDNGVILEDEQQITFRKATRLAVEYDRDTDITGVRTALLVKGTTTWCPDLFDDTGTRLHFDHPPASSVFTVTPEARKVVESANEEERYTTSCMRLSAVAPGRAKITARLGLVTREVEVRVVAEADVRSMEIRQVAKGISDADDHLDVDDATLGTAMTDLPVLDPQASLPREGYVAFLTLADGGKAAARLSQLSIKGEAVTLSLDNGPSAPQNTAVFSLYGKKAGTATVTATVGAMTFTQELRAVAAK